LALPRPCDVFSIEQSVKFELSELDDTPTNRSKVLKNLISNSIKDTSLEYLQNVDPSIFDLIKNEFLDKSFQVSQTILGSNDVLISYENPLKNFNSLLDLVTRVYSKATSDQELFVKETANYGIPTDNLIISESVQSELKAGIVELVLEGLCFVEPKILDRKEGEYVAN